MKSQDISELGYVIKVKTLLQKNVYDSNTSKRRWIDISFQSQEAVTVSFVGKKVSSSFDHKIISLAKKVSKYKSLDSAL